MSIGEIFFWVGIGLFITCFIWNFLTIAHLHEELKRLNDYLEKREADNDET